MKAPSTYLQPYHDFYIYSIVFSFSATLNFASVLLWSSSIETPGAISVSSRPPFVLSTSNTHCLNVSIVLLYERNPLLTRSVMMVLTTLAPVNGSLHS